MPHIHEVLHTFAMEFAKARTILSSKQEKKTVVVFHSKRRPRCDYKFKKRMSMSMNVVVAGSWEKCEPFEYETHCVPQAAW